MLEDLLKEHGVLTDEELEELGYNMSCGESRAIPHIALTRAGHKFTTRHSSYLLTELLPKLANKNIYYLRGQEVGLGLKLGKALPQGKGTGFYASITHFITGFLPEETSEVVRLHYPGMQGKNFTRRVAHSGRF